MKKSFRLALLGILAFSLPSGVLNAIGSDAVSPKKSYHAPAIDEAMEKMDGPIVTLPIPGILCPNSAVVIRFEASGTYNNDNVFTAELSDASGSFASPTVIGSVPGPGNDIPPFIFGLISAPAGSGYRIRVVSSSPAVIGSDNGSDLVIQNDVAPGIPSVSINGPTDFCYGSATTFLTSSAPTGNLWYPGGTNTNPFIGVVSSGCYYTLLTAPNGCTTSSVPVCINVNTPIFTFLAYSKNDSIVTTADTTVTICEGDSAQLAIIVQGGEAPFDIFYTYDGLGSVATFTDVGEPFGQDHIYRFYTTLPGIYSVIGLTDNFPTNCGSNGNSGVVGIQTTPPPVTSFSYNPFCGSPSQPPVAAPGFLGGGVYRFEPEPGDSATINPTTGVITGATIGGNYTVNYTVQGPYCEASSNTTFTVSDSAVVDFDILPFCANTHSADPVTAPGFVGGGTFAFAVAPGDGASISPVTGIISGATPLATYIIRYTSPAGPCQATGLDTVTTFPSPEITGDVINTLCGDSTGSITAQVSGGSPSYTFSWSAPGGNTAVLDSIPAGSYTLTVTDQAGCQDSQTFEVINSNQPNVSLTAGNATCGASNGSIQVNVADSPGPFAFQWNDLSTLKDRSNLAAGSYSVSVFDSTTGCTATASTTIANEGAPQASFTLTNSLCAQSVGAVDVTVTGGTGTITHHWSNGMTTEDITGLPAGVYTDTIRDENNCTVVIQANIINENQFTASAQVSNPTCGNPNGGSINISITGGQAPFTFEWSPNSQTVTEDAFNLPAGTYSVKITGSSQCSTTVQSVILPAVKPSLSFSKTDATCGNNDGAVDLSVSGGSGTYIYEWSTGETTEDISNLGVGTYSVIVRDAADTSCKENGSITIIYGNQPVLNIVASPSACVGNTGAITMDITNGSGQYRVNWTGPGGFTSEQKDLSGLAVGAYQVSVYDSVTTCEVQGSANIEFDNAPQLSATVVNTSCGLNNGLIDVTITGGQNPSVVWLPGNETTQDLVNLTPGIYEITVTDENQCVVRDTFAIAPSLKPESDLTFISPSCANDTGSIDLTLVNANSPIVYVWRKNETIFANTEDVNNLGPGTYRVTATDANGCVVRDTVSLNYQNMPVLNFTVTNTPCGLSQGTVDLEVSGGTPGYTVEWTGPNQFNSGDEDIQNLAAGCYNAKVNDAAGCEVSIQACVQPENAPVIAFVSISPSCNLENGSITAQVSGGVAPYSILWSGSGDTSSTIQNVGAGTYALTVTDNNGCEVSSSHSLTNTGVPALTGTQTNTTCGNSVGSIDIQVSGGKQPYTFSWSPGGETTEDISNLEAGSYTVTVTDSTGCQTSGSFTIENSDAPQISYTKVNTTCGNTEGSIDITVSPAGTYSYTWSGTGVAPNAEDQTNLGAGFYKVVVRPDGSQCSDSLEIEIINSNLFTINGQVSNATCGLNNGAIAISMSGGTSPFTIAWSCSSASTDSISGLAPGFCEVTVQDAAGCEVKRNFQIQSQPGPAADALISAASCGACNGSIDISMFSGVAPYTFQWSDQASVEDRSGLCGGVYTVTITDSNHCSVEYTYEVQSGSSPVASIDTIIPSECGQNFGAIQVSVSGGTGPYTYNWIGPGGFTADTEDISALIAGVYELSLTDASGCDTSLSVSIINSDEPELVFDVTNALCGQVTGSINLIVNQAGGGAPHPGPHTFSWTGPGGFTSSSQSLTNVPSGTYEVTVITGACEVKGSATITNTDAPTASITTNRDTICEGELAELTIHLSGDAPFTFKYTDGVVINTVGAYNDTTFTFSVDPNHSTTYTMVSVVEDSDPGCFGSFPIPSVSIGVNPRPASPVISASGNLSFCQGDSVTLTSSVQTGNVWSDGSTSQSIVVKTSGNYVVTITNQFDCSASDTAVVNVMTSPVVNAGSEDTTVCKGIQVQFQGSGADSYLWSPSIGLTGTIIANPLASPPETTTYVVTGTNACGTGTDTVTISILPVIDADLGDDRTVCAGDTLHLNVDNVPGAVYAWGPNSAISGPVNQNSVKAVLNSSGAIFLSTTNLNGCMDRDTLQVSVTPLPQAPVLSIDGDSSQCQGSSVVIHSTIGTFVRWYRNQDLIAENVIDLEVNQTGEYTVVSYGGACPVRSNPVQLTFKPVPNASIGLSGSPIICRDACIALSVDSTASQDITWITPDGNKTTASIQACAAGKYILELRADGCISRDSVDLTVKDKPEPPVISPEGPISICEGQTVTLNSSYSSGNQWLKDSGHLSGFTSNYILLNSAGMYSVVYTDENGCSSTSEPVEIIIKPVSPLTISASDSIICSGSGKEITLTASQGFSSYEWSNQQTGNSTTVTSAGVYEVRATNSAGCVATKTFEVFEGPAISTDLFSPVYYDDFNVTKKGAKDGSIDLTVSGGTEPFTYLWSNEQTSEDLQNLAGGWYFIKVTDHLGCIANDSIFVKEPGDIKLPNGFTPNGDGYNDQYVIKGIQGYPGNKVSIFNRWGNLVYSKTNYVNDWEGISNDGNLLSDGTYFIVVDLNDNNKLIEGFIDLRRSK